MRNVFAKIFAFLAVFAASTFALAGDPTPEYTTKPDKVFEITLKPGTNSAIIQGSLNKDGLHFYKINLKKGQSVECASLRESGTIWDLVYEKDTENSNIEEEEYHNPVIKDGVYVIRIFNDLEGYVAPYKYKVTVKN